MALGARLLHISRVFLRPVALATVVGSVLGILISVALDLGGGSSMERGRGAPLALRLWVESILCTETVSRRTPTMR